MKRIIPFLLIACVLIIGMPALADDVGTLVDPVVVPPEWLAGLLIWLKSMPYVGPVLTEILKWVGVVASVATALSFTVQMILTLPEVAARFAGAPALADKIKYWSDKIIYWLKFFSIRNAQK